MKPKFLILILLILSSVFVSAQWSDWKPYQTEKGNLQCKLSYAYRKGEVEYGAKQKCYVRVKNLNPQALKSITLTIHFNNWKNTQTRVFTQTESNGIFSTWFAVDEAVAYGEPILDVKDFDFFSQAPINANAKPANADVNRNASNPLQASASGTPNNSYALIIGVSEYKSGWPNLPGVKEDMQAIEQALKKQGFVVETISNPDKLAMDKAYETFLNKYGVNNNRLLLYYAGHGHTLKTGYSNDSLGFIVPSDAPNPFSNPDGFKQTAISMQRIEEYALKTDARHVMFVFDACFSGSVFSNSRSAMSESLKYKLNNPVRQFITSGSNSETVPDKSIFRQVFTRALDGEADMNRDGYVTGTELGEFLQNNVINYSKGAQHPQYGKIRNPNLDKGDFLFVANENLDSRGHPSQTLQVKNIKKTIDAINAQVEDDSPPPPPPTPTPKPSPTPKREAENDDTGDANERAAKDNKTNTAQKPAEKSDFEKGANEINNPRKQDGSDAGTQRVEKAMKEIEEADRAADKKNNAGNNQNTSQPKSDFANGVKEIDNRVKGNGNDAANQRLKNAGVHIDDPERGIQASEESKNEILLVKSETCDCSVQIGKSKLVYGDQIMGTFKTRQEAIHFMCSNTDIGQSDKSKCWKVSPADACK